MFVVWPDNVAHVSPDEAKQCDVPPTLSIQYSIDCIANRNDIFLRVWYDFDWKSIYSSICVLYVFDNVSSDQRLFESYEDVPLDWPEAIADKR